MLIENSRHQIYKKSIDINIVMTNQNGTVHISFKSKNDKDKGFFELI
jgi:hypothetical protein